MTVEYVNCAVCGCQACTRMAGVQASRFECARCGIFVLTISAEATIEGLLAENPSRLSLMSYALRRMQRPGVLPEKITTSQLPSFWSDERLPTLQVQIDNLLSWIGDNQKTSLDYAVGAPTAIAAYIGIPISAAGDVQALSWLRNQIDYQPLLELAVRHHCGFMHRPIGNCVLGRSRFLERDTMMLASFNRRSENVVIKAVIIPKLKLCDIQREVFCADFVERADVEQRPRQRQGIIVRGSLQPTSATKSARNGHAECVA